MSHSRACDRVRRRSVEPTIREATEPLISIVERRADELISLGIRESSGILVGLSLTLGRGREMVSLVHALSDALRSRRSAAFGGMQAFIFLLHAHDTRPRPLTGSQGCWGLRHGWQAELMIMMPGRLRRGLNIPPHARGSREFSGRHRNLEICRIAPWECWDYVRTHQAYGLTLVEQPVIASCNGVPKLDSHYALSEPDYCFDIERKVSDLLSGFDPGTCAKSY